MVLGVNQTVGLVVVVISVIAYFTVKNSLIYSSDSLRSLYKDEKESSVLVVITSAQEHFEQRQSIRRTWLKLLKDDSLKYYFLIGKFFCHVPPRYRLSQLSCEEWKPSLGIGITDETIFSTVSKERNCFKSEYHGSAYTKGFSFILNHKIVLYQFGVNNGILQTCNGPVRLILLDAVTLKRIITSTFTHENNENVAVVWKNVSKTILPSGFEGQLILDAECNEATSNDTTENLVLRDDTNVIRFLLAIDNRNKTSPYVNKMCTNVGFSFSIADVNSVRRLINERNYEWSKWQHQVQKMTNSLNHEIQMYRDILLLNIVDVYHNLPMKMLHFYKWLNPDDYDYILKTDDDVFIDLPNVIRELRMKDDKLWDWWSCFRKNWPVQRAGKWRELNLNLTMYPNFPSGAGYIINKKVIKYLSDNQARLLSSTQGEDVAVGLWLSKLKPKMHLGYHCQWSCGNRCREDSCNVMELSISDMFLVWEQYINCNNSLKCRCK